MRLTKRNLWLVIVFFLSALSLPFSGGAAELPAPEELLSTASSKATEEKTRPVVCGRQFQPLFDQHNQLDQILTSGSLQEKVDALHVISDHAHELKTETPGLCAIIRNHFRDSNPNVLSAAELLARSSLKCSDNPEHLLELIKVENEFVQMLAVHHLAYVRSTNVCRQTFEYFQLHPEKLSFPILEQLSFVAPFCGVCDLADQYVRVAVNQQSQLKRHTGPGSKATIDVQGEWEFIQENLVRCMGYQGDTNNLLQLLKGFPPSTWPFPSKNKSVSFPVQAQALTALEMKFTKGAAQGPEVCNVLARVLRKGHPQLKPEAMSFLKKANCPNADDLIMEISHLGEKKYHQIHAILTFMGAGQKAKAIEAALNSKDPAIRKIGLSLQRGIKKRLNEGPKPTKTFLENTKNRLQ